MLDITEALKKKHLKVTPQRIAIYKYLTSTKEHPAVEDIYKNLASDYSALSLATIYKTLDIFKSNGFIQELNIDSECLRYDADCTFHAHFLCSECGRIYDFPEASNYVEYTKPVSNQAGYSIDSAQIYFYGKCRDCNS